MAYVRATTAARGYGGSHKALRKALAPQVATGTVRCWRCGELIPAGEPWDLGHADEHDGSYAGPEHTFCNRSAGVQSRPDRRPLGVRSRTW